MTLDEFEKKLGAHHDWLVQQYNKGIDEVDMHRKLIKLARATKRVRDCSLLFIKVDQGPVTSALDIGDDHKDAIYEVFGDDA